MAESLASADPAARLRQQAEALAAALPPLLVGARALAATVAPGAHGRRRVGTGEAFWQFRRYQPGDPASLIDWRQSAKSEPLFVRENEWDAAHSVWLWRDPSPSMAWRSARGLPVKRERAELLALALAVLLVRGGERVALLGSSHAPDHGRGVLERLARDLTAPPADPATLAAALPHQPLPRHARLVLISDFLEPLDQLETLFAALGAGGVRGHLLQLLDPAEETLPYSGRVRFHGLEQEGELLVPRAESLREAYHQRLTAHRAGLAALARRLGWSFSHHRSDTAPTTALLGLVRLIGER